MKEEPSESDELAFGRFRLSANPLRLVRDGAPVRLRLQALQLLKLLAGEPGRLVTQAQIRRHLWPARHVDFAKSTHLLVREIRRALDDDAQSPSFIETLPRQGYRFIAAVERSGSGSPVASRLKMRAAIMAATALVVAISIMLFVILRPAPAPVSDGARTAFLKGEYLLERGGAANLEKSVAHFENAITLNPDYAPANAALAHVAVLSQDFDRAEQRARAALAVDPRSAEAHVALGMVATLRDWNWRGALAEIDYALRVAPGNARAHGARALVLTILGDSEEALKAARAAEASDPVSALVRADVGVFSYFAGEFDAARRICGEAYDLAPELAGAVQCMFKSALLSKDRPAAVAASARLAAFWESEPEHEGVFDPGAAPERLAAFNTLRRKRIERIGEDAFEPVSLAVAFAELGDYERAGAMIEKARRARAPYLPLILRDPMLRPLHDDVRYRKALAAAGLGPPATM